MQECSFQIVILGLKKYKIAEIKDTPLTNENGEKCSSELTHLLELTALSKCAGRQQFYLLQSIICRLLNTGVHLCLLIMNANEPLLLTSSVILPTTTKRFDRAELRFSSKGLCSHLRTPDHC